MRESWNLQGTVAMHLSILSCIVCLKRRAEGRRRLGGCVANLPSPAREKGFCVVSPQKKNFPLSGSPPLPPTNASGCAGKQKQKYGEPCGWVRVPIVTCYTSTRAREACDHLPSSFYSIENPPSCLICATELRSPFAGLGPHSLREGQRREQVCMLSGMHGVKNSAEKEKVGRKWNSTD